VRRCGWGRGQRILEPLDGSCGGLILPRRVKVTSQPSMSCGPPVANARHAGTSTGLEGRRCRKRPTRSSVPAGLQGRPPGTDRAQPGAIADCGLCVARPETSLSWCAEPSRGRERFTVRRRPTSYTPWPGGRRVILRIAAGPHDSLPLLGTVATVRRCLCPQVPRLHQPVHWPV